MPKTLMKVGAICCALSFLLVICACSSSPKIDSTSEKTFKTSLTEIYESLPKEKAENFKKVMAGMGMMAALAYKGDEEKMRQAFDGMTYDDLMNKAREVRDEMKKQGMVQ